jgi:selenide,water dikinase
MLAASGVAAEVDAAAVPLLDGVLDLARSDVVPSGTKRNHAWLAPSVDWQDLTPPERFVLADAQTSGGLLLATERPDELIAALTARGTLAAATIGRVHHGAAGRITVTGRLTEA